MESDLREGITWFKYLLVTYFGNLVLYTLLNRHIPGKAWKPWDLPHCEILSTSYISFLWLPLYPQPYLLISPLLVKALFRSVITLHSILDESHTHVSWPSLSHPCSLIYFISFSSSFIFFSKPCNLPVICL